MRRRTVLRAGALAAVSLLGGPVSCGTDASDRHVLYPGEPSRDDMDYALSLATTLNGRGVGIDTTGTEGGVANLVRLGTRGEALALVMADAAEAAMAGQLPQVGIRAPIRAIGRLYQAYLHLVVMDASPFVTLADLAGRRVSLGGAGSASALVGRRMLEVSGLTVAEDPRAQPAALAALGRGELDAVLWSGGIPAPELASDRRADLRLIELDEPASLLRATYGNVYERVTIPSDTYARMAALPTSGVACLMLCREDTDDDTVADVVRTLLAEPIGEVADPVSGRPYLLDPYELIDTAVPLHPAAVEVYREWHG